MGKKKKKKKDKKKGQQQLQNLTTDQLILRGKQSLDAKKPRDAISFFKLAIKKQGVSDDINTFLFRAYLLRESQLRKKNLTVEADMVKKQAQEYMPWVDQLSEADMFAYISTCSNKEAIDIYAGYLSANKRSARAEQFLANRLFKSERWELSDKLDESLPLRRDIAPVRKAIPLMDAAKWEEALDVLASISRTSPFAPVRMFCRAMVSFYNEDDADMSRALSMIPDDFPLSTVVENLKNTVGNGNKTSKAEPRLQCLWDGPVNIETDIKDLLYDLEHRRFRQAESSLSDLAEAVYPQEPTAVLSFMLESIWNMVLQYKIEEYDFHKMVSDLLPPSQAELLLTKTRFLDFKTPFTTAGQYLSLLENEFPDARRRKIAHAFILLYIVEAIRKSKFNTAKDKRGVQKYKKLLGIKSKTKDAETMLMDMTTEGIRLDPKNRKGYELLVTLSRASRPAKNAVEASLTDMLSHFADDPWPCLELASVFYEKNAFRKAENILKEAMIRAPHDSRVIDRHAIALLISAEKNIQRKKFHLVERDIGKAEELMSKKVAPFIIEKRIIFQIASNQPLEPGPLSEKKGKQVPKEKGAQLSLFKDRKALNRIVENELARLSLFEQLRILAVLIGDIKRRTLDEKKSVLKEIEKIFDKASKKIKELPSSEIIRLLTPLNKEYSSLFPSLEIAPIFLKKHKDILKNVEDSEIFSLYDLIFEKTWFGLIQKDIKQRIRKAKKKDRLLLDFYLVTIQHIKGEKLDPDLFFDIIDEAPPGPMRDELRTASRRLSKHASGVLKKALEMFEFDILDELPFFDNPFHDPFDDFFDDDDVLPERSLERELDNLLDQLDLIESDFDLSDEEAIPDEITNDLLNGCESFVDSLELRGAPDFVIMGLREILRSDPKVRRDFDMMTKIIMQTGGASRLSREARVLLLGKRKRK
ncbi:hypothetical protein [Desulfonema magnum]|uniref:Tetratricopeptide domain-containing protein n=1 Tax=Desulfonema magnum TaxID=45655 RepID=A0A975BI99_9BACT|nr:hypothetical protein [Desulfonema magnum]QTA86017.1 tetratricopeptide domain-containing protein [Desulfonema magnum]